MQDMQDQEARGLIDLRGRVAMVAGGSGGIGACVAETLAQCGADVALSYHAGSTRAEDVAANIRAGGRRARVDRIDATDLASCRAWTAAVLRDFGAVDILANCCGWSGPSRLFNEQDPEDWPRIVAIEMTACFNLSRAVLDGMIERGRGRIVTIGSESSKSGLSGMAVSAASRGGVNAFSKSLAREVGRHAITVNVVCPGPTETATLDQLRRQGDTGEKLIRGLIAAIPLKRVGTPREIAAMVAFLASDEAAFVTGQTISVGGGLTMG